MNVAFVYNVKRSNSIEEAEFDTEDVIESITRAIESSGAKVTPVEMTKDGSWIRKLCSQPFDLVFNTAEGYRGIGREAFAPTVFDQLNLAYVGSGAYTCFLTLDKYLTNKRLGEHGVRVPDSVFIVTPDDIQRVASDLSYPVFVKPNFEGSSKGISIDSKCNTPKEFIQYATKSLKLFTQGLIVEQFIEGIDITLPYVESVAEGVLEPVEYVGVEKDGLCIYDYEMKNTDDSKIDVICPARISHDVRQSMIEQMKVAIKILGVKDLARADFRVTPKGEVYFIEINALPSLQPGAGLFSATAREGLDYNQTLSSIIAFASKSKPSATSISKARSLKKRKPNVALVFNMKKKMPGESGYEDEAEFDSESTINAIANSIKENGYPPKLIEADRNLPESLLSNNIDIVFNIAEGMNKQSREAQVPAICDLLGIEHTGSDAACLSISLNKNLSSKLVQSEGLLAPRSVVFYPERKKYQHSLNYPVILKPNLEGTSKGIFDSCVVGNDEAFLKELECCFKRSPGPILCEEFIQGREFTVGVAGSTGLSILGISEIVFHKRKNAYPIYSYEVKQIDNPFDNDVFKIESPPKLTKSLERKIGKAARDIFQITGCRDIARIDFRVTDDERVYFIEINPLPGLSPGFSDLAILAERNGISYNELIGKIIKPAVRRWRRG
ncbi:hypothetical protein DSLASN_01180 [Desulfoluna limicola]|uniref:D-alanine--D-alanine ligase n=1 Tax=Desulfoluna limicola TaxID=2810562 RepID=A0ABN6EYX5_9BACT|nr:ATP-grasp domain-containing protein [Desulfoluna limicola]BCS94486.1 hypothetical protein DSLASN_01180 [Desulfoluna limicola]